MLTDSTTTSITIGDLEIPLEKASVMLELIFSLTLGTHPWESGKAKSGTPVPKSLRKIAISTPPTFVSATIQYMLMTYLVDEFEAPHNWTVGVTAYSYKDIVNWWKDQPEEFRAATQEMMAAAKLKVLGDPDEDYTKKEEGKTIVLGPGGVVLSDVEKAMMFYGD